MSSLRELAARISAHADRLAGDTIEPSQNDRETHLLLLDDLTRAQQLITTGPDFVSQLAVQNNQFACVRWLLNYDIPSLVPLPPSTSSSSSPSAPPPPSASVPFSNVAAQARVPEHQLRRISRMAMLAGFLSEPAEGRLAHSPLSAAFASSPGLQAWGRFVTDASAPMVTKMVEATDRWARDPGLVHVPAGAVSPAVMPGNATAYNLAWNTELPVFQHVGSEPELGKRYADYFRHMTVNEGMSLAHLVAAFPIAAVTGGSGRDGGADGGRPPYRVVVDLGGGVGHASSALAAAFPNLRFIVQDQPKFIAQAEEIAKAKRAGGAAPDPDAASRPVSALDAVVFQAHDFFTPQPTSLPASAIQQWHLPSSSSSPILPPAEKKIKTAHEQAGSAAENNNDDGGDGEQGRYVDVFFLRQILHDWRDEDSLKILRNLLPRLRRGGHVVIMDTVLPVPGGSEDNGSSGADDAGAGGASSHSLTQEARLRVRDLTMLQAHNAYERELREWEALLAAADPKLRLEGVATPFGSLLSVLSVRYDAV